MANDIAENEAADAAPLAIEPPARRRSFFIRVRDAVRRRWRRFSNRLDHRFTTLAARSRWAAYLYYSFYSGAIRREERAVLAGRVRFLADAARPDQSAAMLRRGIHRLEKGLLMRPRRNVFALDYIVETFDCYEKLLANSGDCSTAEGELAWAHDVLEAYCNATGDHPKINAVRNRFQQLSPPVRRCANSCVPYSRDLTVPPPVSYDALMELAIRRRSVRWFEQRSVPRELIEKAVAVAAQSPSACNRQPFVFRIFDEPELAHRVGAIPAGTAGFSHNFPAVVVVVGRLRAYFSERDRHVIYIDASLASMSLVFALETLGLSSCCINWPDIEDREQEMEKTLNLEPDERPIMLIAVGFPDPQGLVAYSQKKPTAQLCRYNLE